MVDTICPYCGKTFQTYPSWVGRKYCPDCKGKDKKVEVKCAWCGKSKKIKPSQFRDSKNKRFYCNFDCKGKWLSANRSGSANSNYKGGQVEVFCEICGKPKMIYTSKQYKYSICNNSECRAALNTKLLSGHNNGNRKLHPPIEVHCSYCGKVHKISPNRLQYKNHFCKDSDCQAKWMSENLIGEKNANWRGGFPGKCDYCGKDIWIKPSRQDREVHFCDKKCVAKWLSENTNGEKSSNWQGGKSFEPYGVEFNNNLKEAIRQRDGYKCQICGCSELENIRKLPVHHIDYDKTNNHPDNLIALCDGCHSKTGVNRQKWIRYFARKNEKVKDRQLCFRR